MSCVWFRRKVPQVWPCCPRGRTDRMYCWTVRLLTRMPSLSSSPRIRSAPHRPLAVAMAWIRSMSSTRNRPRAPLRLDLWCQRRVNRSRCQRRRVSGLTTWRASRHAVCSRARNTRISRSSAWRRGRDGAARRSTRICWRRSAFSATSAERGRTASMLTAHTSAAPVRTGRSMCLMVRPHSWTRRRTAVLTARVNRFSTLVSSRTGCWAPGGGAHGSVSRD